MSTIAFDVEAVRGRFSALQGGFVFFDGPGGTQVLLLELRGRLAPAALRASRRGDHEYQHEAEDHHGGGREQAQRTTVLCVHRRPDGTGAPRGVRR